MSLPEVEGKPIFFVNFATVYSTVTLLCEAAQSEAE